MLKANRILCSLKIAPQNFLYLLITKSKNHQWRKLAGITLSKWSNSMSVIMRLYDSKWLLFLNLIFILYWSRVDLQCYVSIRSTAKWFSYTYIHSFPDSFPIQVIKEYWVEFPVLYSRPLSIIYFIYSSVYMLIPNS